MLSYLIVPLQYLYAHWRAERLAESSRNPAFGERGMRRLEKAVRDVEILQLRFPGVTERIDARRHAAALRATAAA